MDSRETTPPSGGFVISEANNSSSTVRTAVYIDGFNLYFGCLKRVPECRWLDIETLARKLCTENNPAADLVSIKYFTAPIKDKLSPRGPASRIAQQTYLRALAAHCPDVKVILGNFFIVPGSYYADAQPIDFTKKYRVLRAEEKHTDVNIALHMLADATDGMCDQQILFSNDSDCAPILAMIKQRHPDITIGIIPPILTSEPARQPSKELTQYASWSRKPLSESLLFDCQLPDKVPTRKATLHRPKHWRTIKQSD